MRINYHTLAVLLLIFFTATAATASRAPLKSVAASPYASAVVLDADSGEILFSRNADLTVYPASTLKLMVLLVILEQMEKGQLQTDEMVQVTVDAYKMGGSQVYLDPKEQFPVEDLLYALMIQSANDAAVALATHVAGTTEEFVAMMNAKARELGMTGTRFHSVHGLPPARGQKVDVTTARDFAKLCRYLSTKPEVFKYTGTRVRDFRGGKFIMRTHNHLLNTVEGCDGFKTGYFAKAGFSIAATAKKNDRRVIAIVMGSKERKVRDAEATKLLAKGFALLPAETAAPESIAAPETELSVKQVPPGANDASAAKDTVRSGPPSDGWGKFFLGLVIGFLICAGLNFFLFKRQSKRKWQTKRI